MVYITALGVYLVCYSFTVKLCSAYGVYYCIWRISCVLQYYSEVMQCAWYILLHLAYILCATVLQRSYAVCTVYIIAFGVYLVCYSTTVRLCSAHSIYYCIWRISCVLQYYSEVMQCELCILLHLAYILCATVLQ